MAFKPPISYPYGGGGLPRTKIIGGKRYYLFTWGPHKTPQYRLVKMKEMNNAISAREVKLGRFWVIYMR